MARYSHLIGGYVVRRKSDGKYLRGTSHSRWGWTRFKFLAHGNNIAQIMRDYVRHYRHEAGEYDVLPRWPRRKS